MRLLNGDRQLTAFRFYLRDVLEWAGTRVIEETSGYTRYLRLINLLYDWQHASGEPLRIVTFNYDTILEDALQTIYGWDLRRDLSRFVERDDCRLFKLHGSVTWSQTVRAQAEPYAIMVDAALMHAERGGHFNGEIRPTKGPFQVDNPPEIWVPALAVPMEAKTAFECPSSHLQLLREDLASVRRVLIVGWRAAEPHVVKLLYGSNAKPGLTSGFSSLIVSGGQEDAEQVMTNLGGVIERSPTHWRLVEPGGFKDLLPNRREHLDGLLRPLA